MAGVNDLKCAGCGHRRGSHNPLNDNVRERGHCLAVDHGAIQRYPCTCKAFAWPAHEEDPDQPWDDYKSGYTDIDGNYFEPPMVEP